jgi:hypothetical protein
VELILQVKPFTFYNPRNNLPESTLSTQYAVYSPDGKKLILTQKLLTNKKAVCYDIEKKSTLEIYAETDTAWFERHGSPTRFIDSNLVLFESEVSGFNNLYFVNSDGSGFRKAAGGNYTILESVVDSEARKIYLRQ